MSRKKILLLGGSAQQVIAIRTAKKLGYYTILCDYLSDNPGQYVADKYYNASTTDVEAVYQIAKDEHIDGILAYASDPAALPAALVAERLGLPTNPARSVEVLGLKFSWRKFLHEHGFACPKFYTFSPDTPLGEIQRKAVDFTFPLVVKPTDSSGSKGVTKLEDWNGLEEAIAWANYYSRNKILLVEEYIQRGFPSVIGGDIFVWNGKVVLYGIMECVRDVLRSPLIPIGKKTLQISEKQRANIYSELQRVVSELNIHFGELNVEIILDKDDKAHFLELGPRAGGNMIPIQLSDTYGIDLVKANVQVAMGEKPDFLDAPIKALPGCYVHYVLHSYVAGIFKRVEIDKRIIKNVYRQVIYKHEGDSVEVFDGAGKALGIIFLHFDTIEEMEIVMQNIDSLCKVIIK